MFIAELAAPDFADYDLSSLRTGIMAGSPCPVEVMKQVIDGMDMARGDHLLRHDRDLAGVHADPRRRRARPPRVARWAGRIRTSRSRSSTRHRARPCRAATPGELCTRGYSVMLGYWDEPEKTAEAIDAARWMHTGDLATMDDDGYVDITGRIKDMVIRGGENVYPREIEEFLYTHPDILDVAGHRRAGREVRRGADGLGADARRRRAARPPRRSREFCRGKLAHYKIPRYVARRRRVPDDGHRQGAQGARCARRRSRSSASTPQDRLEPMADDTTSVRRCSRRSTRAGCRPTGDAADAASALDVVRLREMAHHPARTGPATPALHVDGEPWPCAELRAAAADAGIPDA